MYQRLYDACKKRYNSLPGHEVQQKCNSIWNQLKACKTSDLQSATEEKIGELLTVATQERAKKLNWFAQLPKQAPAAGAKQAESTAVAVNLQHNEDGLDSAGASAAASAVDEDEIGRRPGRVPRIVTSEDEGEPSSASRPAPKPRQDALKKEICVLESDLNAKLTKREAGLLEEGLELSIKKLRCTLESKKTELRNKEARAVAMRAARARQKTDLERLRAANPNAVVNSFRSKPGRPPLHEDQTGLMQAIIDICMHGSSAADKRRSEALRACKTLSELSEKLRDLGYHLSNSAVYLRLLPRRSDSVEGRRHVHAVPVRLCRPQADAHRDHPDQRFCMATIYGLKEVASILGPKQVIVISQDDKAKVPVGKTCAKSQAPMLMHVKYKVRLSDHDFVVGPRHQLTPSVYAGLVIKPDTMGRRQAVTYSGPTYIAIRSGKHSSSTASTHAHDLRKVFTLKEFEPLVKTEDGDIKPVLMLSVDGGPDENPRYSGVIANAIGHFKEFNLDAVFIYTNAPGRSAFNEVERRMAPLSRELTGVVLPYDKFGNHLDSSGRTIDEELELQNFKHAGESLAEIWSTMTIDGHDVVTEYIEPDVDLSSPPNIDHVWYSNHVRESQYLLQVVKCSDAACCSAMRSSLKNVLFQRFLPAPFPVSQDPFDIPKPEAAGQTKFPSLLVRQTLTLRPDYPRTKEIPYDLYCPSQRDLVAGRVCPACGLYFASKKSMDQHRIQVHGGRGAEQGVARVRPLRVLSHRPGELLCAINESCCEWIDVESLDLQDISMPSETDEVPAPIIDNISKWIEEGVPFQEDVHFNDNDD